MCANLCATQDNLLCEIKDQHLFRESIIRFIYMKSPQRQKMLLIYITVSPEQRTMASSMEVNAKEAF